MREVLTKKMILSEILKSLQLRQINILYKGGHVVMLTNSVVVFIEENVSVILKMKLNLTMIKGKDVHLIR